MTFEDPILIVDDEIKYVEPIVQYLEENGINVVYAHNGETALKLFLRYNFPVVISDILMPKMDGLKFLEKVKEANPLTRVLLFSILNDNEIRINARKLHADDYITKVNYSNENLLKKINDQYQKYRKNESAKRELRTNLRDKIAMGQTRTVIDELMYCPFVESKTQNEIVILSASLSEIEKRQLLGLEYRESGLTHINQSVLKILDKI